MTSISPNNGVQGQGVTVTLTGTNFVAGATIGVSGAGITVSNTTVLSATQITATLSSTNPVNGATVVPTNREITATFSKAMTALTTATFTVSGGGTSVAGTVNYDTTTRQFLSP
jgi:hypothetical protein